MIYNLTWEKVKIDNSIELIEHPIINSLIPKEEFYKEFSDVLDKLNGETMTDYIDFYFQRDHINKNNLKFIGENEKMDFYDWAVDEKCLPELKEIHQGESKYEQQKSEVKKEKKNLKKKKVKIKFPRRKNYSKY